MTFSAFRGRTYRLGSKSMIGPPIQCPVKDCEAEGTAQPSVRLAREVIPERFSRKPSKKAAAPMPMDDTTPNPVITTLLWGIVRRE